ncbi:MAG: type II 3-dehydroquinate dehydratase [Chlorobi bacterium]|nr:type II 3-dehydroquinate dehydratase [Chlorobiota bacterium]
MKPENKILIINGPNLNLLGKRKPEIYGRRSFDDYLKELRQSFPDLIIDYFQSNHEGDLIDRLHAADGRYTGVVLNAGGYTHTSVALRDAVEAVEVPVTEVHISDIRRREAFRRHSYLTDVCRATYAGHGLDGYRMAVEYLLRLSREDR